MPATVAPLADQLKGLAPGETLKVEIPRAPQFVHLTADVTACLAIPNRTLELVALAFESRVGAQVYTAGEKDHPPQAALEGTPILTEIGAVRMSGEVAIDTAARLLEFGLQFKFITPEEIEKRFSQIPIKVSF